MIYQQADRTALSFPNGISYYDLNTESWYKPISNVIFSQGNLNITNVEVTKTDLYFTGNRDLVGYVFHSSVSIPPNGRIGSLEWTTLVSIFYSFSV